MLNMDLLSRVFLECIKEARFPQKKVSEGQIWFDCQADKHGIVIGNALNYIGGGFTAFSDAVLMHGEFLLNPSVQDFLWFTPRAKVEIWGCEFSVKIDDDENPKRFSSANPLEACAKAYLYLFNVSSKSETDETTDNQRAT